MPKLHCCRFDLLTGFQYFHLSDNLNINQSGLYGNGVDFVTGDSFKTFNNFYGYDLGGVMSFYMGRWFFDLTGNIALGANNRSVNIQGGTNVVDPFGSTTTPGGLLTQPSNIGNYHDTVFAVLPQGKFNVGFQLTRHLRLFTGYTFMYNSNVLRAGNQIDPVINSSQAFGGTLVGSARPAFDFHGSGIWVQGINFGAELRF